MTVSAQIPFNNSTAAPGATVFPYGFKIVDADDLLVMVDGVAKTLGVDYTVSGVGSDVGGDVTFVVPMAGGEQVLRKSNMAYIRETDYQQLGDLHSSTLNNDQDAPVLMIRQLAVEVEKSVRVPDSLLGLFDAQLPTPIVPLAPLVPNAAGTAFEYGSTTLTGDMLLRPNLAGLGPTEGAALVARAVTTDTFQEINGQKLFRFAHNVDGPRVEIVKSDTPANYNGTRAAFVLQHKDDADLGSNSGTAGAYALFTSTGDGAVDGPGQFSSSIWQGFVIGCEKYGDGSQHAISVIGQLQAFGPGGYNELGLLVGNASNLGSMQGTIHAAELLIQDGAAGVSGVNNWPTNMAGYIARIGKWNNNVREAVSFVASSEGDKALTAILGVNDGGLKQWIAGIDISKGIFTGTHAMIVPNATNYSALDTGGTVRKLIGTNNVNVNLAYANGNSGYYQIANGPGTVTLMEANHTLDATNPWQIYVNGALKRITVGAADSGGVGFRYLRVPN